MMLWTLFYTFIVIGAVSFGGGYAMIPVIERMVVDQHGWLSFSQYLDVVSLAGMSPGPIAANLAVLVGYRTLGMTGAVTAVAGIVLPSFVIAVIATIFFYKFHSNRFVQSAFYGLRPAITGVILYGAYRFGMNNGSFNGLTWHTVITLILFVCALFALMRWKLHPLAIILLSAVCGIIIF